MTELKPQMPFDGLLPVTFGETTLRALDLGAITSLSPYPGFENGATVALKVAHGMGLPGPGRITGKAGGRAIWSGQGQAFLIGPEPDKSLSKTCAITDQSDAWAVAEISGPDARDVLARLCPLDLRAQVFKRGHTARSLLGHMNAQITRTGTDTYMLMVFRSMAGTAAHELSDAMRSVSALDSDA